MNDAMAAEEAANEDDVDGRQAPGKDLGDGFGARLKEAMALKGMKAPELGRLVGRTRASIGSAKNGNQGPWRAKECLLAARALDVDVNWLVLGEGVARPCSTVSALAYPSKPPTSAACSTSSRRRS